MRCGEVINTTIIVQILGAVSRLKTGFHCSKDKLTQSPSADFCWHFLFKKKAAIITLNNNKIKSRKMNQILFLGL